VVSFTEHKVDLATGALTYLKGGDGPAILHLHAAAGPRLSPMVERLAARHTLYQPVAPGFNETPLHPSVGSVRALAGVMAEFAEKVIGKSCDVVAESFGGWVSLWLAVDHPDLVAQLVLEGPAGLRDPGTGGLPSDPKGRNAKLYFNPERAPTDPRYEAVMPGNGKAMGHYAAGITLDEDLLKSLPKIKARALILFGDKEEVIPVETARRLQAGIKHSHFSYIYKAAHAIEFDQPGPVARLIGAFLERGEAFVVPRAGAA
jgi:pimeloyl-ACP methyl ester carboxylesterase